MDTLIDRLNADSTLERAYIALSMEREGLSGSTVRVTDLSGDKIGSGYVAEVHRNAKGDRIVSLRLLIDGLLYQSEIAWDLTRICDLSVAEPVPIEFDFIVEC